MGVEEHSFRPARRKSFVTFLNRQFNRLLPVAAACLLFLLFSGGLSRRSYHAKGGKFPLKIWQTWKVDPLGFELRDSERARTWTMKNPNYRYEVLTDAGAVTYVETHFGSNGIQRPDIVAAYKSLSAKVIKADLLRYLIMYIEGGIYTDIDVEALKPLEMFIPERFDERDVDMVVGIETDEPAFADHPLLGLKAQSFVQWTFMCKPRLPVMMRLIDNILIWLNGLCERQGKPISELEIDFDEVLTGTGPSAFTSAVLKEMSIAAGRNIDWSTFHNLFEAKLVSGVLVHTSEAFAAGTGHSDSGNHGGKGALVKHHFHASSWPTNHPRYKHPVYGEVEKCNWNVECVKLWDSNIAFFEALPEQEKQKLINLKKIEDAKSPPSPDGAVGGVLLPAEIPALPAEIPAAMEAPHALVDAVPPQGVPAPDMAPAAPAEEVGDEDKVQDEVEDETE